MRGLAFVGVFITAATPASAATVQLRPGGMIDEDPVNRIDVAGEPGEASSLSITVRRVGADRQGSPTLVTVQDAALALTPLRGCATADSRTVTCRSDDELGELQLKLGDGDDRATVSSISADQFIFNTIVDGGRGNDVLGAGDGGELTGGEGDDVLTGSPLYETMDAGPGDDVLFGGGHGDFLAGGPGDDIVHGGPGNDDVIGGGGADEVAPAGADRLLGEGGDDVLDDADGDSVPVAAGPDVLDGGPGDDGIDSYLRRSAPVVIDLTGAVPAGEAGEGDVLTGIERAFGGAADDRLIGDAGPNWLDGRNGNDNVTAGPNADTVLADDADVVSTDEGDDVIRTFPSFAGRLACGTGRDVVRIDAYSFGPAEPRGPFIPGACERLSSGTGLGVLAHPALDDRDRLRFDVLKFRCCRLRLTVGSPVTPFARFGATRITAAHVGVRLPDAVAADAASGGVVLRATVRPLGLVPFAWRFFVSGAD